MEDQSHKKHRSKGSVTLVTGITGVVLSAAIFWFNNHASGYEYYVVGNLVLLFFIPILVIFGLGEDASDFGFGMGYSKKVKWWTLAMFAALLPGFFIASRTAGFQGYYPIFGQFSSFMNGGPYLPGDGWGLAYGWISYGMYMFFWEFFFRGYLLFGLWRSLNWGAVILQAVLFCILHYGKPPLEFVLSFPAGIILGILALRAKSFLPGFVLHWAATVAFDIMVIFARHGRG